MLAPTPAPAEPEPPPSSPVDLPLDSRPSFPTGSDMARGPAAVEPNGNVLLMVGAGLYDGPVQFLEWDGKSLNPASSSGFDDEDFSASGMMLVLPTGQILLTDLTLDIEIYTPPPGYRHDWAPKSSISRALATTASPGLSTTARPTRSPASASTA